MAVLVCFLLPFQVRIPVQCSIAAVFIYLLSRFQFIWLLGVNAVMCWFQDGCCYRAVCTIFQENTTVLLVSLSTRLFLLASLIVLLVAFRSPLLTLTCAVCSAAFNEISFIHRLFCENFDVACHIALRCFTCNVCFVVVTWTDQFSTRGFCVVLFWKLVVSIIL